MQYKNGVFIVIMLFCLLFASCKKLGICKDDKLQISKTENNSGILKIDGYYYAKSGDDKAKIFYFYKNGVAIQPGVVGLNDAQSRKLLPSYWKGTLKDVKYYWGLYSIMDKAIAIEYWHFSQCGMTTIYEGGEIVDDSTINISHRELREDGKKIEEHNEKTMYIFVQTEKPDSTNKFIK